MRTEDDLRSALWLLERETPDAQTVLRHATERTSAGMAGPGRRPGRRLMASAAASAAVIAIAVAAALAIPPRGHGRAASQDGPQSLPRYYMALVPTNPKAYASSWLEAEAINPAAAVVKDRITGQVLATVRPPKPYIRFMGITGAADDRTFVLTAWSTIEPSRTQRPRFFYARFSPADDAVTLTPLALPGLPVSSSVAAVALSPDGTKLAVAGKISPVQIAVSNTIAVQITVYSLPSGAARTWTANLPAIAALGFGVLDQLSWSRTGTLGFDWGGSYARYVSVHGELKPEGRYWPSGEYLLNTNIAGGSLLADSRNAFCPGSSADIRSAYWYLTPDGTKIIALVDRPIPLGQTLPSCFETPHPGGASPTAVLPAAELEEFSATTGRAVSILDTSRSRGARTDPGVYWISPSGNVVVVFGTLKPGSSPWVFGVLSGSRFIPIPGSTSPPLMPWGFSF